MLSRCPEGATVRSTLRAKAKPATLREGTLPAVEKRLRLKGDLQLEGNGDIVAQGEASGFNSSIPVDAIGGAVDHEACGSAGFGLAVTIGGDSAELTRDDDGQCDATKREVAFDGEVVAVDGEGGRSEIHGGELIDEEEITRAQMVVSVLLIGVDRGDVDARDDGRVAGIFRSDDGQVESLERSANLADGEVLDAEGDLGVRGIELPGAGNVVGVGVSESSHSYMQAYGVTGYSR
jgi:hypothetical protein